MANNPDEDMGGMMEDHENAGDLHADQEMYDEQEIAHREAPKKKKKNKHKKKTQAVQEVPKVQGKAKKGGKQRRAERKRKYEARKLAIADAANFPKSHALPDDAQDEDELKKAEALEKEIDHDKAKVALGALFSLIEGINGKKSLGDAERSIMPNVDLTKVINKPSTFDGATGRYHEWKNEVQMYLRVMNFPADVEVSVVQGYLRGTALAWWSQKLKQMAANEVSPPTSFEEFLHYLDERFEHRNPELAARDKLMGLRQNNLTLHQYLREFEGCYAFIPTWDEADKIHRFLYGLKPFYRNKFCVDPATHQWWTSFDELVAYISAYISDDVSTRAEEAKGVLEQLGPEGRDLSKHSQKNKLNVNKLNKFLKGRRLSQLLKALGPKGGRVQKRFGAVDKVMTYTNANGETVERTKHLRSWCHQQKPGLCLGCYQTGHVVAECTNAVAQGAPHGYRAPSRE
jgi:hypothetical protein